MTILSARAIKKILSQAGIRPQKKLGQHFLVSQKVLDKFLESCELKPDDCVVEVGTGLGSLTTELAKKVRRIYSFEVDSRLLGAAWAELAEFNNVAFFRQDFLKFSADLFDKPESVNKLMGSIPYQITSPLIHKLILEKWSLELICLIVQQELAEKITARSPRASYLSNLMQAFGQAEIVGEPIPPSAFWPQPRVRSAILRIHPSGVKALESKEFSRFLHRGFAYPRKMLRAVFKTEDLQRSGIESTQRPQELKLRDWLKLYRILGPGH